MTKNKQETLNGESHVRIFKSEKVYWYLDINRLMHDIEELFEKEKLRNIEDEKKIVNFEKLYIAILNITGEDDTSSTMIRRFLGRPEGPVGMDGAQLLVGAFDTLLNNPDQDAINPYKLEVNDIIMEKLFERKTDIDSYVAKIDGNLTIKDVIFEMRNLLEECESSNFYQSIPKSSIDGFDFYQERIDYVEKIIQYISYGDDNLQSILSRLLRETEIFMKSYEPTGVVDRWKEYNPNIDYFDVAYDLYETSPDVYQSVLNSKVMNFKVNVTSESLNQRKKYFDNFDKDGRVNNLKYDRNTILNKEIVKTFLEISNLDIKGY